MIEETPKIRAVDQFRASVLDVEGVDAANLIKEGKDRRPMTSTQWNLRWLRMSATERKIYEDYLHYEKGLAEQSRKASHS